MRNEWRSVLVGCLLVVAALAQAQPAPATEQPARSVSAEARAALLEARQRENECKGRHGDERTRALSVAARAYDEVAAAFSAEPHVAAQASWSAAELWRRQGGLLEAEARYLTAARLDPKRYEQRALLAAADMQRRSERAELAVETYGRCVACDPRSRRAHRARLWVGRMSLRAGRLDAALEQLQEAFREAPSPGASIETADLLAKAWIAKGDLESAEFCIEHAADVVSEAKDADPALADRLQRAYERMSAHRALQREKDRVNDAMEDAIRLDQHRREGGGGG